MKIAVISDIHGNHHALSSVLDDCKKNKIELLFVLGDLVGYYYHPEIVLEMLKDWNCEIVKGNHEEILEDIILGKVDRQEIKKKYGLGHEMAIKNLSAEQIKYLSSLNKRRVVKINNITFELNHSSPWDLETYIYPDTNEKILKNCLINNYDYVLIGHSHYMFSYRYANKTLINCGSVGQSRMKGGSANWVKIDTINNEFELKNVSYPTTSLINELVEFENHDSYSINILKRK
jgi:putative phosphoesterase